MADIGRLALHGGTPMLSEPYEYRWPRLTPAHRRAVLELLDRAELSYYGREGKVAELEDLWSSRLDGRRTLATSSGTAALHSAFFALGAGAGHEVICPTNTFLATVMPLSVCGAVPVLCDAEPDTGNIDPAQVEALVTSRTVGVVVTHLWGHPCDMGALRATAERHGLWLVEDCSHAHGATWHGAEVGTFGDAAAFSFQSAKVVAGGQGGLLASAEQAVHERACLFGHFRVRSEQDVTSVLRRYADTGLGLNYRMHPLAAALTVEDTRALPDVVTRRGATLDALSTQLLRIPGLRPPTTRPGCTRGAYYGYKLGLAGEWLDVPVATLVAALRAEGLQVGRPGSRPLHQAAFFRDAALPDVVTQPPGRRVYRDGDFPVAERLWATSLSLPTLTGPEDDAVVEAYAQAFAKVHASLGALRQAGPVTIGTAR